MNAQEAKELAYGLAKLQIEGGLSDDTWPVPIEEDPEYGYSKEDRELIISSLDIVCEELQALEEGTAVIAPKEECSENEPNNMR